MNAQVPIDDVGVGGLEQPRRRRSLAVAAGVLRGGG